MPIKPCRRVLGRVLAAGAAGMLLCGAVLAVSVPAAAEQGGLFGLFAKRGAAGGGGRSAEQIALLDAYPGAFTIEGNAVVFADGTRVVWDDGRRKTPQTLLTDADVEDMFAYAYPPASAGEVAPARDDDPGRVRSEAFFRALYGGSERAVGASVRRVAWLGGSAMTVTTRFGVDKALERVRDELAGRPELAAYLAPPAGGFLWRNIAGTDRLSVHSFGAAVDINTKFTNYWRWDKPAGGVIRYRNRIPLAIVAAFERNCFIWGGRWYHYDTMHFEYRPELLPGCRR